MDAGLQKRPNKEICFRPRLNFRMLQGQKHILLLKTDLSNYNHHLYKIFTARPKIDNAPPYLNPYNYVHPKRLKEDAARLQQIDAENKKLLGTINAINRSPAKVDCWNTYKKGPSIQRVLYNKNCVRIMRENAKILHAIESTKSQYSTKDMMKHWRHFLSVFDHTITLEKVFHIKKPSVQILSELPSLTSGLPVEFVLPRQKAFLDLKIKDGVHLGQIVVELYYEYAPKIVTNFVAHCDSSSEHSYKNCRIYYAEKHKFIALGDMTQQNGRGGHSIYTHNIDLEANELPTIRPGLLIAIPIERSKKFNGALTIQERIRQRPSPLQYNSRFAITLSNNCKTKHYCPVFGKIIKGSSVLVKINDMLKKCGTPLVTIIVSQCGVIPLTREEEQIFNNVKGQMLEAGIDLNATEDELQIEKGQD